jgi:hypothetical protein
MRFAMEEMKIAICTLVQKFQFFPVEETPVRSFTWSFRHNFVSSFLFISLTLQEKLRFDNGLLAVLQPVQAVIGTAFREANH